MDIVTPNESEKGGSPPSEADSSSLSREQLIHDQEKLDVWQKMSSPKRKWWLTLLVIIRNVVC